MNGAVNELPDNGFCVILLIIINAILATLQVIFPFLYLLSLIYVLLRLITH